MSYLWMLTGSLQPVSPILVRVACYFTRPPPSKIKNKYSCSLKQTKNTAAVKRKFKKMQFTRKKQRTNAPPPPPPPRSSKKRRRKHEKDNEQKKEEKSAINTSQMTTTSSCCLRYKLFPWQASATESQRSTQTPVPSKYQRPLARHSYSTSGHNRFFAHKMQTLQSSAQQGDRICAVWTVLTLKIPWHSVHTIHVWFISGNSQGQQRQAHTRSHSRWMGWHQTWCQRVRSSNPQMLG